MKITVRLANYHDADDGAAILKLLNAYALDPMGGGEGLSAHAQDALIPALAALAHAFSVLAYNEGGPVGLANCFYGFSTFAGAPLVNIHDVFVIPEARGKGVASALFGDIERRATARQCCKITLEVLAGNTPARALYASLGYGEYKLDAATGAALFWQKPL